MKRQNLTLLIAPISYKPSRCTVDRIDARQVIRLTFNGGRVMFDWHQAEGISVAIVDGEIVGEWTNPTVGKWFDILYTLETKYNHLIS